MKQEKGKTQAQSGFTFIDVLVGVGLVVLVFTGILGAYQLGVFILAQSRDRVVATSLANEFVERARNLPYADVGVQGGFPDGVFLASQDISRNGKDYAVAVDINFVADETDGLASPEDDCVNDYKRVLVTVGWEGRSPGQVSLATDVAPANALQECEDTGGLLGVTVFNAVGIPIEAADVQVTDVDSTLSDVCSTNASGTCTFPLPASPPGGSENYKIEVEKLGYSSVESFRAGDTYNGQIVATPEFPHGTVLEGQITETSFSIDQTSTVVVSTRSPRDPQEFTDAFDDAGQIDEMNNVEVAGGAVQLVNDAGVYEDSGDFTSVTIGGGAASWDELEFSTDVPANTSAVVYVLYNDGVSWVSIPDEDLPGNEAGFPVDDSPIDLSGLDGTYPSIRLQGSLATTDTSQTPQLQEWSVAYFAQESFPIANTQFSMRGAKTVGTDGGSDPIYKYDQTHTTESPSGLIELSDIEWDTYSFSSFVSGGSSLDIDEVTPSAPPISVLPNSNTEITFYLEAQNSLLVNVEDAGTAQPIFSAQARLTNAGVYDVSQGTDEDGQTLFIPLNSGSYDIEVTAEGYDPYTGPVSVSGDASVLVPLTQNPE